jgi:hypothetical protein
MQIHEIWANKNNLRETKIVHIGLAPLNDGEARVAIDKFALTANNVSYAVSGDQIGYWKYYPAPDPWGKVPVWGFGDVIESRCKEIPVGERIWGFFPMASHVTLSPGRIGEKQFTDMAPHRAPLPSLYNNYQRTNNDPPELKSFEDQRCLLFPLFATSYVLYDYLVAHEFFGASDVLVGSASSKTGFGLAYLIHRDKQAGKKVIGLTSPHNRAFVESLNVCDRIATYDAVKTLDASRKIALVDMSGSGALIADVHNHFGENVMESCIVGATHWEAYRNRAPLPGAKPAFFFAPTHIAKREQEWGRGVVMAKAMQAAVAIASSVAGNLEIVRHRGDAAVQKAFVSLVNNEVPPRLGLMLSLKD